MDIRVEYPHDLPPQVSIPPLLLIVFVENAFKHGVSYSKPSFIHMRIDYADGKVVSTIGNSSTARRRRSTTPESDWRTSANASR